MPRERWADQDGPGIGTEPDDDIHPVAWRERMSQRQSTRTADEMVRALDPPETEHPQRHYEVRWLPELVYDDRGWPPSIGVFYD